MNRHHNPLFVIIADGTFDQVCESARDANREASDLRRMGCHVKIKKFDNWNDVNAFEDSLNA